MHREWQLLGVTLCGAARQADHLDLDCGSARAGILRRTMDLSFILDPSQGPVTEYIAGDTSIWQLASAARCASATVMAFSLDLPEVQMSALSALLSEDEMQRAARFHFEKDRRRFQVGRARLRQLLGQRLGVAAQSVEFRYGVHGKPSLSDAQFTRVPLRFNLSNSQETAVAVLDTGGDVGIDVELIRILPDRDELARRNFSPGEQAEYFALPEAQRTEAFFNAWTRKEAFIKALGLGLHCPLDSFDVSLRLGEPAQLLRVGEQPGDQSGWRLVNFSPAPGFAAALVTAAAPA